MQEKVWRILRKTTFPAKIFKLVLRFLIMMKMISGR